MKVIHISSYPPMKGGIADYEKSLVSHLRNIEGEHDVISFNEAEGPAVESLLDKNKIASFLEAYTYLKSENPDIIHIQHELNLYGRLNFLLLASLLLWLDFKSDVKVVTTLHTVEEYNLGLGVKKILRFVGYRLLTFNLINQFSDELIVHNSSLTDKLNLDNLNVVPHGVKELESPENIRSKYGIEEEDVFLLCAGFLAPGKGFEDAIKSLEHLPDKYKLVIAGGEPPNMKEESTQYVEKLEELSEEYKEGRITLENRYIPEKELENLIYSADYMIFPYRNSSQSGMMHRAIGAGKKIVASDLESFKTTLKDSAAYHSPGDSYKLAKNLKSLKNDTIKLKEDMVWEKVAQRHLNLYKRV